MLVKVLDHIHRKKNKKKSEDKWIYEAVWWLFNSPCILAICLLSVYKFTYHSSTHYFLMQWIYDSLQQVLRRLDIHTTMLIHKFECNKTDQCARPFVFIILPLNMFRMLGKKIVDKKNKKMEKHAFIMPLVNYTSWECFLTMSREKQAFLILEQSLGSNFLIGVQSTWSFRRWQAMEWSVWWGHCDSFVIAIRTPLYKLCPLLWNCWYSKIPSHQILALHEQQCHYEAYVFFSMLDLHLSNGEFQNYVLCEFEQLFNSSSTTLSEQACRSSMRGLSLTYRTSYWERNTIMILLNLEGNIHLP